MSAPRGVNLRTGEARACDRKRQSPPIAENLKNLREIETQLVAAYRRYQLVDRELTQRQEFISPLEAERLREDAVLPARLLLARLWELEDAAETVEAEAEQRIKDARARLGKAIARLIDAGHKPEEVEEALRKLKLPSPKAIMDSGPATEANQNKRTDRPIPTIDLRDRQTELTHAESTHEYYQSQTAAIRKLIKWARARFPNLVLTIDDAEPKQP